MLEAADEVVETFAGNGRDPEGGGIVHIYVDIARIRIDVDMTIAGVGETSGRRNEIPVGEDVKAGTTVVRSGDVTLGSGGEAFVAFFGPSIDDGSAVTNLQDEIGPTDLTKSRALGFVVQFVTRDGHSLAKDVVYLNHASIGTVPRVVHEAQVRYLALCETNPWLHVWGGAWEEPRADIRRKLADELGCEPAELALNHNTTEGFNLLAQGLPLGPKDEVLFPAYNHPGASVAWDHFGARRGFSVRRFTVPMTEFGSWSSTDIVARFKAEIRPGKTRVLVLPHVDNILGVRHPVAAITKVARKAGVEWIAVDGAQTVGQIPLDLHALGIDFYCASPHKWLQAPKGTGLFFARKKVQEKLDPMWVTWGQRSWRGSARGFEDYGTRDPRRRPHPRSRR